MTKVKACAAPSSGKARRPGVANTRRARGRSAGQVMATPIHLIGGEKGGVGKSLMARVLAQYLIDKHGRIAATHIGEGSYDEIDATIRALLAEP